MPILAPGTEIERLVIEEMIGAGAMAEVYRARHKTLGTDFALKLLTLRSPEIRERLIREGRVQASLRHPNIVSVSDVVEFQGWLGLVLEYIDGPDLEGWLAKNRPSESQVDALARGMFSAVQAAHEAGILHRDLKPSNVMLTRLEGEWVAKISDFGIAKILTETGGGLTRDGVGLGTPLYMAPEQVNGASKVDPRADVFSLGAILYELVCGQRAFQGNNLMHIITLSAQGLYRAPKELRPDLPRAWEQAIIGALQPNPDDRPRDVTTLREVWFGTETKPPGPTSTEAHAATPASPAPVHEPAALTYGLDVPMEAGASHEPHPTVVPPAAATGGGPHLGREEESATFRGEREIERPGAPAAHSSTLWESQEDGDPPRGKGRWLLLAGLLTAVFVPLGLWTLSGEERAPNNAPTGETLQPDNAPTARPPPTEEQEPERREPASPSVKPRLDETWKAPAIGETPPAPSPAPIEHSPAEAEPTPAPERAPVEPPPAGAEAPAVRLRILADPFDGHMTAAGQQAAVGSEIELPAGRHEFLFEGSNWSVRCSLDIDPTVNRIKFIRDGRRCITLD